MCLVSWLVKSASRRAHHHWLQYSLCLLSLATLSLITLQLRILLHLGENAENTFQFSNYICMSALGKYFQKAWATIQIASDSTEISVLHTHCITLNTVTLSICVRTTSIWNVNAMVESNEGTKERINEWTSDCDNDRSKRDKIPEWHELNWFFGTISLNRKLFNFHLV